MSTKEAGFTTRMNCVSYGAGWVGPGKFAFICLIFSDSNIKALQDKTML